MLSTGAIILSNDNRKIAQFNENGITYKALNCHQKHIIRYQIDSHIMSADTKRCDNALEVVDDNDMYFIELKGEDIKKAATQIYSAIIYFASDLANKRIFGRIVCSRVPRPDIQSTQMILLQRKLAASGGNLLKGSKTLKEKI